MERKGEISRKEPDLTSMLRSRSFFQLASDAEAKVKATKDPRGPKELQKDTAEAHEKQHKS